MQHQLAYERVNIASLKFDPRNARKHDDRNIKAIMDSLSKFGQQKAIVVGEDNIVIAGNGTLEAAKRLGWDTIDVRRSGLKSDEATAYAIADNRSAELAEWDDPVLGDILSELKESGWELDDLGFNDEDIKNLIQTPDFEPGTEDDQGKLDQKKPIKCPGCGHVFTP
jgi:ParB family chromosome partitioning protein